MWAPGGYFCKCVTCLEHFVGDKRARSCADCAYAVPQESVTVSSLSHLQEGDWREGLHPSLVEGIELAQKYPTPRSDKAIEKCNASQGGADLVVGEVAKVLERELAHSQVKLTEAEAAHNKLRETVSKHILPVLKAQKVPVIGGWDWPYLVGLLEKALQPTEIIVALGKEWWKHNGREDGFERDEEVDVLFRCGEADSGSVSHFSWSHASGEESAQDIIGHRPTGAPDKLPR